MVRSMESCIKVCSLVSQGLITIYSRFVCGENIENSFHPIFKQHIYCRRLGKSIKL